MAAVMATLERHRPKSFSPRGVARGISESAGLAAWTEAVSGLIKERCTDEQPPGRAQEAVRWYQAECSATGSADEIEQLFGGGQQINRHEEDFP